MRGVVFELPQHSSAARARAVRSVAVANGWTVAQMDDAEGGWSLFLKRGNLRANIFLWRPEVYRLSCGGAHPDDKCFNTADVQRDLFRECSLTNGCLGIRTTAQRPTVGVDPAQARLCNRNMLYAARPQGGRSASRC